MSINNWGYIKTDTNTKIEVQFYEVGYMCQVLITIYNLSSSIPYNPYTVGSAPRPYNNVWIDWGLPQNAVDPLQFSIREDLSNTDSYSLFIDVGGSNGSVIENRGMNLNKTFCYILHPNYVNSK